LFFNSFLVLAKSLAGKGIFDLTYLVSSGTLNLNSINHLISHLHAVFVCNIFNSFYKFTMVHSILLV